MPTRRFQVAMAGDTAFPRDRVVNTLHFHTEALAGAVDDDPQQLVDDLAALYDGTWCSAGVREILVRAYDIGPPPNEPVAEKILNVGVSPASLIPREIALCLSFRGEQNTPRTRGRLYFPVFASGGTGPVKDLMAVGPSATLMNRLLTMADGFANLGGVNVDWVVRSQIADSNAPVQHAWVDDEWDVVRSRGLRPSGRYSRDYSE